VKNFRLVIILSPSNVFSNIYLFLSNMPKEKQSLASRLNSYVSEFSECSGTVFTTDGKILYCKLCDSKVGSDRKFNVKQHIDTDKHKAAIIRKQSKNKFDLQKTQQQLLSNTKKILLIKIYVMLCYRLTFH